MKEIKIKLGERDLGSLITAIGDMQRLAQRTLNKMKSNTEDYTFYFEGAPSHREVLDDQKDYINRLDKLWRKFNHQRKKHYDKKRK